MARFLDRFIKGGQSPASSREDLVKDLPIMHLLYAGLKNGVPDIEFGWRLDEASGDGLDYVYKAFAPQDYKMTDSEFRASIQRILFFSGLHNYGIRQEVSEDNEAILVVSVRRQDLHRQADIIDEQLPVLEDAACKHLAAKSGR